MPHEDIDIAKVKIETLLAGQGFKGCTVAVASKSGLRLTLADGCHATGTPSEFDIAISRANAEGIPLAESLADAGLLDDID